MIRELKSLDPEIRDISGLSPLHVAAKMPHSSALRAMLDVFYSRSRAGTSHEYRLYNVNHVNGAGDSALHICCVEGDADKVRMMLQSGADLEKRSRKSYTLLHRLVRVRCRPFFFNPLDSKGKRNATSNNTKLVHWPLMCGLLHFVQRGGDWARLQPAQAPPVTTRPSTANVVYQSSYCCIMVRCSAVLMW